MLTNPLAYFFGHTTPSENTELFRHQMQQLAAAVKRRMESDVEGACGCSCSVHLCRIKCNSRAAQ